MEIGRKYLLLIYVSYPVSDGEVDVVPPVLPLALPGRDLEVGLGGGRAPHDGAGRPRSDVARHPGLGDAAGVAHRDENGCGYKEQRRNYRNKNDWVKKMARTFFQSLLSGNE